MRVAFFTAGSRGAGHRARGIALRRALGRAGFSGELALFGPAQPFGATLDEGWETVEIRADLLGSAETARATDLGARLAAFAPDLLVVDMFWAPLRHLLPLRGCECWLLLRSSPPAWLEGPAGAPFDAMQYARIIAIEPISSTALTDRIDPVVIVNPEEREPQGALRRRLGVREDQRLVGVMHAGNAGEHASLVPAMGRSEVVASFDLHERDGLFPIAAWLGDCDALHCGAGYNSYWEARWLGYAARTSFTPFTRVNDDQRWRLSRGDRYPMGANGADTLARWIARGG
ncbi:MAG TPA: hypothetical protein VLT33_01050 [Labilithrix sp.]|nr:hypothetical protein [Labilithrix sp.]